MKLLEQEKEPFTPVVLDVLMYPNPMLQEISGLVTTSIPGDENLQKLISNMETTLRRYRALGLAAIQVGVPLQIILVKDTKEDKVHIIINPALKSIKGERYEKEGCLSVPGVFVRILRPESVEIEYFDRNGDKQTTNEGGMLGRAILHEIDHLAGITFLDRMNFVQKTAALKKLKTIKRKMF